MKNSIIRYILIIMVFCFISILFAQENIETVKSKVSNNPLTQSDIERQIFDELNLARTDPHAYAAKLREYRSYYNGSYVEIPGRVTLMTNEGTSAVDEAIRFMEKAAPLSAFRLSKGLSSAAKVHVKEQGPSGRTGHNSSNGSSPFDRMERFGQWQKTAGENISYGQDTAKGIIIQLLIDDGVSSRGHRKNIFNAEYAVVGIGYGPHSMYGSMCVFDFAGEYIEKE